MMMIRKTPSAAPSTGRKRVAAPRTSATRKMAAKPDQVAEIATTTAKKSVPTKRRAANTQNAVRVEPVQSLVERVERAVAREIAQIEAMVGGADELSEPRSDAEHRARTLASLTRTLLELRRLRADDDVQRTADDDAIPRDLDELRRALSRRLDQLVDGAAPLSAAGDE